MTHRVFFIILPISALTVLFIVTVGILPQQAQAHPQNLPAVMTTTTSIAATDTLSPTTLAKGDAVETPPPTYIKGLYMTYSAVGHEGLRTNALNLIDTTELNAVIIDIKGDKGLITYKSDVPTATAIGANNAPTIRDWPAFMQDLKDRNIYTIARIVVFKDNFMGRAHPEWAVKTASGELWLDREELPWLEAFHPEVWDYNIALAVEAAQRGFDEIQFDYIRFPTDGRLSNIVYSRPIDDPEVRKQAINSFLARTREALKPYDVKLGVDVFGYTTWHKGDFRIGQDISEMAPYIDVISPMAYPSTYDHGLPGMPQYDENTVAYPYEVVYESMIRGLSRVKAANPNIIVRPWIQDFPDYGFDRRTYTPDEIREQMFASYDSGGGGWMLWDPRVRYTPEALVTGDVLYPPHPSGELMVLRYETFGATDEAMQRSAGSFRQDLEDLLAGGYYPVNLRDLAVGNAKYKQDMEQLPQNGWQPIYSEELLARRFNYVPAGKRPVVLTFDASHISQYRLLADGTLDPNSAVGVLKAFHDEHPADWPMRATFFVQPEAVEPDYNLFGQPEFVEQKLKNMVEWGLEIGSYSMTGANLAEISYEDIRYQLSSEAAIEAYLPGYEIESLALPQGQLPAYAKLLQRGTYDNLIYDYNVVAVRGDQAIPSPYTNAFDPHTIQRIDAVRGALESWLEFYANNPKIYYVSAGIIPDTKPVSQP